MTTPMNKRFLILIGGPALFKGCDKEHDQTWSNYIVPMQLAAEKGFLDRRRDEIIHLIVYEPLYINRWLDDSMITPDEKNKTMASICTVSEMPRRKR